MSNPGCVRTVVMLAVLSSTAEAEAQSQGRFYAGAAAVADYDPSNRRLPDEIGVSWMVVGGADLTGRLGVRVIVEPPREVTSVVQRVVTRQTWTLPVRETVTESQITVNWGILADSHWRIGRRMRLGALYGAAVVGRRLDFAADREEIQPDGASVPLRPIRSQRSRYEWIGAPMGGVEVPVALGRIEVVPEFRTIFFAMSDAARPFIVRGGIGVRVRF